MLFAVLDSDKKGVRGCLDKDGYDSYRDMYDVKNDKCEDITYDSYTDAGMPPARVYIVNVLPCSHVFKHWRGNSVKSCEHCALENHTPTYTTAGDVIAFFVLTSTMTSRLCVLLCFFLCLTVVCICQSDRCNSGKRGARVSLAAGVATILTVMGKFLV